MNRLLQFEKRSQLFIGTYNVTRPSFKTRKPQARSMPNVIEINSVVMLERCAATPSGHLMREPVREGLRSR